MTTGKVAVPYYGKLHRDKLGYEKIFFIVGNALGKDLDVSLGVWNHKEQSLPDWLQHNGVHTLACREEPEQHMKKRIARLGINILNEGNNDVSKLMQTLMV